MLETAMPHVLQPLYLPAVSYVAMAVGPSGCILQEFSSHRAPLILPRLAINHSLV